MADHTPDCDWPDDHMGNCPEPDPVGMVECPNCPAVLIDGKCSWCGPSVKTGGAQCLNWDDERAGDKPDGYWRCGDCPVCANDQQRTASR